MSDVIEQTTWDGPRTPPFKPARRDEAGQIERLIDALHDQTAAMRELAESNRQVVDLVLAQQVDADDQDEQEPETYLDGSPLR